MSATECDANARTWDDRAKGLSTYAGGGRYDFDRDPGLAWVGKDEYDGTVETVAATRPLDLRQERS